MKKLLVVLVIIFGILYVPKFLILGYHTIRCGGWPVMASNFAASYSYNTSDDGRFYWGLFTTANPITYLFVFSDEYYCSENEAQSHGYRQGLVPFQK